MHGTVPLWLAHIYIFYYLQSIIEVMLIVGLISFYYSTVNVFIGFCFNWIFHCRIYSDFVTDSSTFLLKTIIILVQTVTPISNCKNELIAQELSHKFFHFKQILYIIFSSWHPHSKKEKSNNQKCFSSNKNNKHYPFSKLWIEVTHRSSFST